MIPNKPEYLFDPECYDMAAAFLAEEEQYNTEANRASLAQAIQDAVEDWIMMAKKDE